MGKQPAIYRMPPDPGFVGGYNWSAMFAGLLLLLLVNVAATQFIAYRFDYQTALGRPLLRLPEYSIYQPFAWTVWVFRNSSSTNPQIRLALLSGTLIVAGGATLTVFIVYGLNLRRARWLSANAEDLHGSARWATQEDVQATGLLAERQGVYIGGWYNSQDGRLEYLRHDGPEHVLAFAPTRSGKGVGLVIPTLLAWSESAVVYDVKGENWEKTAGFRASCGHLCFKFSPVEVANTSRFNPLAEIRIGTPRDVSDAQNAADMIVRPGEESPQDRYWQQAAVSITVGMILHVCYAANARGRVACLADLSAIFTRPGQTFRDTLAELENYPHDPAREHEWRTAEGERTATHQVVREKAREMLEKEDKDFSGVLSSAKTALTLFSDPLVASSTSASDFTINDLVNHERPISLYLVIPPSDKIRLSPLIGLIFTMIVNRLTERMDFERSQRKHNLNRLLLMIDEFPSLKRMALFADALSYMAGYGLKAYLITQDIRQIMEHYGPNESIVSNCQVRIAYAPNQVDTAELLSKMAGTKTVQKASYNFSGSRLAPIANHMSATVDQVERPLMTPDEVMRLKPAVKKGHGKAERIVAPGHMLIFISGHYPIYGTQILYFTDPVLMKRVALPPPPRLVEIEEGRVVPQRAADRTRNVISAPEPRTVDNGDLATEPMSPMEKAFRAELSRSRTDASQMPKSTGFVEQLELDLQEATTLQTLTDKEN